jgi:hypothetical protein
MHLRHGGVRRGHGDGDGQPMDWVIEQVVASRSGTDACQNVD